jgi:hypothetical protein
VLAVYRREQVSDGIINVIHSVTNSALLLKFPELLSPSLTVLQGVITASFFGLAVGNGCMYRITGKTLDQLREVLKQIDQLEEQLRSILHTLHNAEDWVVVNDE